MDREKERLSRQLERPTDLPPDAAPFFRQLARLQASIRPQMPARSPCQHGAAEKLAMFSWLQRNMVAAGLYRLAGCFGSQQSQSVIVIT